MTKRLLAITLLVATAAFGQMPGTRSPKVTAEPIAKVSVPKGGKGNVEMMFRVRPGFHINSHKPSSDLYIPTALTLDVPTDVSVAGLQYPDGEMISFPFDPDTKLSVYTGDITVRGLVMAAKSTPLGTYRVHGNLRYQACDNRACYPPSTVPIAFDVTVDQPVKRKTAHANPAQSPHIHN
jgi:Thiol:disulfide interchange protein DsbD, N-terminal